MEYCECKKDVYLFYLGKFKMYVFLKNILYIYFIK